VKAVRPTDMLPPQIAGRIVLSSLFLTGLLAGMAVKVVAAARKFYAHWQPEHRPLWSHRHPFPDGMESNADTQGIS
jgi:hypothetical protein